MWIASVGHLTIDELRVSGRRERVPYVGGAAYVAAGASLWGASVALISAVGEDARDALVELRERGVDVGGVAVTDGATLRLTVEGDGADRRFAVVAGDVPALEAAWPDLRRVTAHDDASGEVASDEPAFDGCHLGPQIGTAARRTGARRLARRVTADVLVDEHLPAAPYRDGSALRDVDAFLPSDADVVRLWGRPVPAARLHRELATAGVGTVVVTLGARGAQVATAAGVVHVPSAVHDPADPLGAGDGFCGGYLAGLLATGDPVEAAVRATVSAALTVETRGALAAFDAAAGFERDARAHEVRRGVTPMGV